MPTYSNARAMRALIKASLQGIAKSPSAIIFSIAFPLIFILVFGFLGGGRAFSVNVAVAPRSDTANGLYRSLRQVPVIKWMASADSATLSKNLADGDIAAIITIRQQPAGATPQYQVAITGSAAQADKVQQLRAIVNNAVQQQDPQIAARANNIAAVDMRITEVREFKTIDFILPGQLGFSLLAAGVFGTAFIFFNMRQTLVLKRFFATPVRREYIILSEGIARMIFQLSGAVIIIAIGHFAFGYTLIHGWATFFAMLALCALGLIVFMGFGFIISGLAKSEATIPPFSNLVTLPQFLLAGTFFPIDAFPKWLQPICRILPLTYLNDALRKVAFDGAGLGEIWIDIVVLLGWGILLYVVAGRVFKWE